MRPAAADDRDLTKLVAQIEAPVFYGGGFHDEQTGAQFGAMLDQFYMSESFKALIGNGRHPDGYAPHAVYRWFEFLEFYVAERTPFLNPLIRTFGPAEFGGSFGMDYVLFEEDRFVDYASYEEALAAYEQEPPVRVLFETGGVVGEEGWPVPNYEASYDSWPPNDAQTRDWYLDEQGQLSDTTALSEGFDQWRHDAEAEGVTFLDLLGTSYWSRCGT